VPKAPKTPAEQINTLMRDRAERAVDNLSTGTQIPFSESQRDTAILNVESQMRLLLNEAQSLAAT
jgi:hypothetical protein